MNKNTMVVLAMGIGAGAGYGLNKWRESARSPVEDLAERVSGIERRRRNAAMIAGAAVGGVIGWGMR